MIDNLRSFFHSEEISGNNQVELVAVNTECLQQQIEFLV